MQKIDGVNPANDRYFPSSNDKLGKDPQIQKISEAVFSIFSENGFDSPYPSLQTILNDQVLSADRFSELVSEMSDVEKSHPIEGIEALKSMVLIAIPNDELGEHPFVEKLHRFVLSAIECVNGEIDTPLGIDQLRAVKVIS